MGVNNDPERLVAEALRAQAARTPLPATDVRPASPPDGLSHAAGESPGQRSGTDLEPSHPADLDAATAGLPVTGADGGRAPGTSLWLIALFAVLLGLAAGAVVGLVTLL